VQVERADAVVIGSGPNGLSAAIRLAAAGRDVIVLEAADAPGGAVRTAELTLPGFRHDMFSSVYPAGAASPVFARMPLGDHGLEWVQPEVAMAHPLDDGRAAALYADIDRTVAQFDEFQPGDGASWKAFTQPYLDHIGAVRRTVLGGFPPVSGGLRLLAGLGIQGALDFAQLLLMPAEVLADNLFQGEHARAWLYGSVLHGDVPPTEAGSGITGFYLNVLGHAVGWPSPRGGADGLSGALASYLASLGGQVRTGARVERVITASGRVAGVEIAGGDRVRADVVVADVTPRGMLGLAGHLLPEEYRRRMARFRYGPQTVKVDWALDGVVPWTAPEARRAGTVHVGGGAQDVTRVTGEVRAGRVPDRPFMLFGQQTIADPTRAPAGKHTAWAYTRVPGGFDGSTETPVHVGRMEAQIERYAPGFGDLILGRHVMGPAALQERDENLIGGDVGGGTYALDQLVFRPVPSLAPYRTPIRGLYIGSASAFPGGAVHGAPGWAAAGFALAESRLPW
jgi:phytoene dehydrogenase-like protein